MLVPSRSLQFPLVRSRAAELEQHRSNDPEIRSRHEREAGRTSELTRLEVGDREHSSAVEGPRGTGLRSSRRSGSVG